MTVLKVRKYEMHFNYEGMLFYKQVKKLHHDMNDMNDMILC